MAYESSIIFNNTIAINVIYIDRVEDNAYSVLMTYKVRPYHRTLIVMRLAIWVDPSLVFIALYLICLFHALV